MWFSRDAESCCAAQFRRRRRRPLRRERELSANGAGAPLDGDMISRESGGELGLRVYHSGQLGRENDTADLARFGVLDITRINFEAAL